MGLITRLYADGGLVGRNPAQVGTWAWIATTQSLDGPEVEVASDAGLLHCTRLGAARITNNNSEIWALLQGVTRTGTLPDLILTDSRTAMGMVAGWYSTKSQPADLAERVEFVRARFPALSSDSTWRLLQGHPTKEDLIAGVGKKRKLPVSAWNQLCDQRCNEVRRLYEEEECPKCTT